jgi:hypothetical protein
VSLLYIGVIELLGYVFVRDPHQQMNPTFVHDMHGWAGGPDNLPTLFRWDATWYLSIARGPYPGTGGENVHNAAFFPLYGWPAAS